MTWKKKHYAIDRQYILLYNNVMKKHHVLMSIDEELLNECKAKCKEIGASLSAVVSILLRKWLGKK